ncbi:choice-of-anchor Q domain-containing protein [Lysobacter soli]|uniref:choice-of-anchor Q domain-containing protein n=1 Tax=Lysobacter soli TaxID=453783 RepID=UPI0037CBC4A3
MIPFVATASDAMRISRTFHARRRNLLDVVKANRGTAMSSTAFPKRHTGCAIALLAAVASFPVVSHAATRLVTNCASGGAGSLRNAVASAADGDLVDMSRLQCVGISLAGAQIEVPQNNLRVIGRYNLFLNGQQTSRIFHHSGTGTLRLERINMRNGFHTDALATGGCVHSDGTLEIVSSIVDTCRTFAAGDPEMSMGGALYARNLLVSHSQLSNHRADDSFMDRYSGRHGGAIASPGHVTVYRSVISNSNARLGGGIYAEGGVTITYSTLWNNSAHRSGAGVEVVGGHVTINKSTFAYNYSSYRCGAVCASTSEWTHISDSTFSHNYSTFFAAGELSDDALITNSTIAFNNSGSSNECVGVIQAKRLELQSSILASNTCYANLPPYDLGGRSWEGYTVRGANNLIGRSHVPVPADTIRTDAGLDPALANNGGPTDVHALLATSPGIDKGNNVLNRQFDQRGTGYPRVRGLRADIGAFER